MCYEFSKSANSIAEPYIIPKSCPLPAWPSITTARLLEAVDMVKSYEPLNPQVATDGTRRHGRTNIEVFNILSNLMQEIGVEIKEETDAEK
jgi:hypothetical protein